MGQAVWVEVLGRETKTHVREIDRKVTKTGQKTVTRVTTETEEQPWVLLSCGHEVRGPDFDAKGKDRKRVRCWECEHEHREADATGMPMPTDGERAKAMNAFPGVSSYWAIVRLRKMAVENGWSSKPLDMICAPDIAEHVKAEQLLKIPNVGHKSMHEFMRSVGNQE